MADKIIICPEEMNTRRNEFSKGILDAFEIIEKFASQYGWQKYLNVPFINSFQIFTTQNSMWNAYRKLSGEEQKEPPVDGLASILFSKMLMAVTPEEYKLLRPEYNLIDNPWPRLLAHEMIHQLHIRIVGGEDKMGPKWFYEGFAMFAAGQRFGSPELITREDVIGAMNAESRGAYAKYEVLFEFFAKKVDMPILLKKASKKNFDQWLSKLYPAND